MNTRALILLPFGLMTIALALLLAVPKPHAIATMQTEVRQTRGPSQDGVDTAWQAQLIELQRQEQTSMASLVWMQITAPVEITGQIPLWGVITVIGGAIITAIVFGVTIKNKQDAHETVDLIRFDAMTEQIKASHDSLTEQIKATRIR